MTPDAEGRLQSAMKRLEEAEVTFDKLFAACARRPRALSVRETSDLKLAALRVNQAMLAFIQARGSVDREK